MAAAMQFSNIANQSILRCKDISKIFPWSDFQASTRPSLPFPGFAILRDLEICGSRLRHHHNTTRRRSSEVRPYTAPSLGRVPLQFVPGCGRPRRESGGGKGWSLRPRDWRRSRVRADRDRVLSVATFALKPMLQVPKPRDRLRKSTFCPQFMRQGPSNGRASGNGPRWPRATGSEVGPAEPLSDRANRANLLERIRDVPTKTAVVPRGGMSHSLAMTSRAGQRTWFEATSWEKLQDIQCARNRKQFDHESPQHKVSRPWWLDVLFPA